MKIGLTVTALLMFVVTSLIMLVLVALLASSVVVCSVDYSNLKYPNSEFPDYGYPASPTVLDQSVGGFNFTATLPYAWTTLERNKQLGIESDDFAYGLGNPSGSPQEIRQDFAISNWGYIRNTEDTVLSQWRGYKQENICFKQAPNTTKGYPEKYGFYAGLDGTVSIYVIKPSQAASKLNQTQLLVNASVMPDESLLRDYLLAYGDATVVNNVKSNDSDMLKADIRASSVWNFTLTKGRVYEHPAYYARDITKTGDRQRESAALAFEMNDTTIVIYVESNDNEGNAEKILNDIQITGHPIQQMQKPLETPFTLGAFNCTVDFWVPANPINYAGGSESTTIYNVTGFTTDDMREDHYGETNESMIQISATMFDANTSLKAVSDKLTKKGLYEGVPSNITARTIDGRPAVVMEYAFQSEHAIKACVQVLPRCIIEVTTITDQPTAIHNFLAVINTLHTTYNPNATVYDHAAKKKVTASDFMNKTHIPPDTTPTKWLI